MLHYLWMFIIGIVVGVIAKLIYPGAAHMGIVLTGVLGIIGSFVGGFIARLFNKPPEGTPVHPAGIVMSVLGALIVLFIYDKVVT
ncbi:MAG TPA: GlsB/YeaQ/YmgE family stress response membrane protein [Steroidobacteraceae bacterium]|nr:GlsB/YeaQ/YmgE family stress response membrane protein [Steroidobacteraceae bacterium]